MEQERQQTNQPPSSPFPLLPSVQGNEFDFDPRKLSMTRFLMCWYSQMSFITCMVALNVLGGTARVAPAR